MTKPDVLQVGSYLEWDQTPLDTAFTMHRLFAAPDRAAMLAEVGPKVRAIATRGDLGADAGLIAACPALELIAVYGVGYDAVDLTAVRARGIAITNTPDVLNGDCADLAVGMMIALARGMVRADAWARSGDWAARGGFPLQRRVWGARAGILGLGGIGMDVARRLEGLGMDIAYTARASKDVPYAYCADAVTLAKRSDFLIVTALANASTRHIVNAEVLRALGPQGMLVNISRAPNVDESALLDALESNAIAGAALDVFEGEPRLNPRFLTLTNVLLQPHHASGTVETRTAMGKLVRDNLIAHFTGSPLLTPVTP